MGYINHSHIAKLAVVLSIPLTGIFLSACGDVVQISNDSLGASSHEEIDLQIGAATVDTTESSEETAELSTIGAANCIILEGIGDSIAIAGLYNMSEAKDESYTEIHGSGKVTVYDYQQDEVGSGENCYIISDGHVALSPLANDSYFELAYLDVGYSCQTETAIKTISIDQNQIKVSYPDENDEDGDGDFYDVITNTYSSVSLSTEDFNLCD